MKIDPSFERLYYFVTSDCDFVIELVIIAGYLIQIFLQLYHIFLQIFDLLLFVLEFSPE